METSARAPEGGRAWLLAFVLCVGLSAIGAVQPAMAATDGEGSAASDDLTSHAGEPDDESAPPASDRANDPAPSEPGASSHHLPTGQPATVLRPRRLYAPLGAPVEIEIEPLEGAIALTLALVAHDGVLLGRADDITPGTVDLASILPVKELRHAAWLQLLVDGVATGTPLVVQPLISRPAIRTAQAIRADGSTRYTRVVGWGETPLDPASADDQALRDSWQPGEPTPWSGVRVYPDAHVILETDHGDIRVALRPDEAPNTAWNFRHLVEGGLYDGTIVHRVVPVDRSGRPFVIQGGDPTGTGDGGPGYEIPLEPSRLPHDFGVISMARADDPDSAGSQFFFCLSREGTARLDGQYCAFGEAVEGARTILSIADLPIADPATGRPVKPATVLRARLVEAPPIIPGLGPMYRRVERPAPIPDEPLTPSGHEPR